MSLVAAFYWNSIICKKWQHILGAVDNTVHCFVANITNFPAVKEA